MNIQRLAERFIVKRAFRRGFVSRSDVIQALNAKPATASRYMQAAAVGNAKLLERLHGGLRPWPLAVPPNFASEAALLEDLDSGRNEPLLTGLFESELAVVYVSWTHSLPAKPGVLMRIVNAIQHERLLRIVYVGLRSGDTPTFRRIMPLALERMNDQWRVIAQDVEKEGAPIRVFVLSRILDAEADLGRKPKGFCLQGHTDSVTDLKVSLNPQLTAAQQEVLSRELRIENGKVRVATRSLHEFKRRFAESPVSSEAVWPPLIIKGGS